MPDRKSPLRLFIEHGPWSALPAVLASAASVFFAVATFITIIAIVAFLAVGVARQKQPLVETFNSALRRDEPEAHSPPPPEINSDLASTPDSRADESDQALSPRIDPQIVPTRSNNDSKLPAAVERVPSRLQSSLQAKSISTTPPEAKSLPMPVPPEAIGQLHQEREALITSPKVQKLLRNVVEGDFGFPTATNPTPLLNVSDILRVATGNAPEPPSADLNTFLSLSELAIAQRDAAKNREEAHLASQIDALLRGKTAITVTFNIEQLDRNAAHTTLLGAFVISGRFLGSGECVEALIPHGDARNLEEGTGSFLDPIRLHTHRVPRCWLIIEGSPAADCITDAKARNAQRARRLQEGFLSTIDVYPLMAWVKPRDSCLIRKDEHGFLRVVLTKAPLEVSSGAWHRQ